MSAFTMPMMIVRCDFDDGPPSRSQIDEAIVRKLGPRGPRKLDAVDIKGHVVQLESMSAVSLLYALKACVELGGTSIDLDGTPQQVDWPTWSERPWSSYNLLEKMRIKLRRIQL